MDVLYNSLCVLAALMLGALFVWLAEKGED